MKTTVFENIITKEKFTCGNTQDIRIIDGVEYITVSPQLNTARHVLMRLDVLKKVKA